MSRTFQFGGDSFRVSIDRGNVAVGARGEGGGIPEPSRRPGVLVEQRGSRSRDFFIPIDPGDLPREEEISEEQVRGWVESFDLKTREPE